MAPAPKDWTADAGIIVTPLTDAAAPPLPDEADGVAPPAPAESVGDAADPAESVADADPAESVADAATEDTPLAITAPPPAVEELDDPESVDEPEFDVSVEEDESADEVVVESEEPDDPEDPEEEPEDPEAPEEPLFTLLIVTVHVLISWKAGLPFESVIGVSFMTQVCVMSPATVEVVDWVMTVVAPGSARLTGIALAGASARNRDWKRKRKARWCGRRYNMAGYSEWAG